MGFRLFDYLVRRRRTVLLSAAVFTVIALIYVIVSDPRYDSKALLMPPMEEGGEGLLSAWMASMNLPSMISAMPGSSTASAVMVDILRSRSLAEVIVEELGLREWYKADNADDAVRQLRNSSAFESSQTGMIRMRISDRDPGRAKDIAEHFIAGLDSINRSLQYKRAGSMLEFTGRQIDAYRSRLERSREEIASFQVEHGIIDFDEQIKGAMEVATALKVKAAMTGVEIDLIREFATEDAAALKKKELELRNINAQLESLMRGDSSMAVFVSMDKLPSLYQRYAALERDLNVNERVYSFLLEKREESVIDLARTTPSVQVVDRPNLPEKKAGMPGWGVMLAAFAVGGLWMILVLLWWGWITMKERTGEEEKAFRSVIDQAESDLSFIRRRLKL